MHQDVVHEAAVIVEQARIVRLTLFQLGDVVGGDEFGQLQRPPGPRISISPMWLTSNTPTAERTALCSSMMPEYWTGMSQPPKSTIFAPSARWTEFKGVTRSDDAFGMKTQASSSEIRVSNLPESEAGVDGARRG